MCRSSRPVALAFGLLAVTPALGQTRPMLGHGPAAIPPRVAFHISPPVDARAAALRTHPRLALSAPGLGGRVGPHGRFGRFTGLGVYGPGLGLALASDLATPLPVADIDPTPAALDVTPDMPPRCVRPLVIKIGARLHKAAYPRVIYGAPIGCTP